MKSDKINSKVMAKIRMRKFRSAYRRIDYAPSPSVLAVIERHLDAGLDNSVARVIDRLIEAGDRVVSGNDASNKGGC